MNCALCLQEKELCRSHIIPEFLYKPFYDSKHRYTGIHSDEKITLHQSGAYEELLCRGCEEKLNKHETYVSRHLANLHVNFNTLQIGELFHFNIDYKSGKLFFMSVLWRMSISAHSFFKDFSITLYNESLRKLILADDPGNVSTFGCFALIPLINGKFIQDWHINPHTAKIKADDVCCVVIGGICYIFFLSLKDGSKDGTQFFIQSNGQWVIASDDARNVPLIYDVLKGARDILDK